MSFLISPRVGKFFDLPSRELRGGREVEVDELGQIDSEEDGMSQC